MQDARLDQLVRIHVTVGAVLDEFGMKQIKPFSVWRVGDHLFIAAGLSGLGLFEASDDGVEVDEVLVRFTACGEVRGVGLAEGFSRPKMSERLISWSLVLCSFPW